MALFGKKKRTLEEILEDIKALSAEEKDTLAAKMAESDTAEPEAAPAETPAEPEAETVDEAPEVHEVAEATETDEVTETPEVAPEVAPETDPAAVPEVETDPVENDNTAEMVKTLTDRVTALEGVISELKGLKEQMDEYVNKQKDAFGYKSSAGSTAKNVEDMTADELKKHILNN